MRVTPSIHAPLGLLVLLLAAPPALAQSSQAPLAGGGDGIDLRLVTFNVRYDTSSREPGELPWWRASCSWNRDACRMPHVVEHLGRLVRGAPAGAPTVIGLQEALVNQVTDVVVNLGDSWHYIGDGRDGGSRGEHCPILYDADVLDVLHERTRWLSDTPETPSTYRGASQPRVVTIGVFRDRVTGERFIHANTHLDAWDPHARAAQVQIALDQVSRVQAEHGPLPVSLAGDFNTPPGDDAHLVLLDSGYMRELWDLAGPARREGPRRVTYTTFSPGDALNQQEQQRLDYIWVGVDGPATWEARRYEITDNVSDGVLISDHCSVVGDLRLVTGEP